MSVDEPNSSLHPPPPFPAFPPLPPFPPTACTRVATASTTLRTAAGGSRVCLASERRDSTSSRCIFTSASMAMPSDTTATPDTGDPAPPIDCGRSSAGPPDARPND